MEFVGGWPCLLCGQPAASELHLPKGTREGATEW